VEALSQQEALRKDAVPWLFYLKYIPAPMSAVENIFKLEAGHHLHFRNGNTMIRRWAKTFGLHDDGIRPAATSAEDVKTAILNAVKKRLDADVPVSALLSGGLDSSIVTCLAAKMTKIDSFTLAIRSDGNVLQFDESGIAAKTAQTLGTRHHTIMLEEADALSSMDGLFSQVFDEPFADPASVLNHLIFKALSAHSKVCLTGDGGDELFGGYRRHQGHLMAHHPLANNMLMRMMARLLGPILPDLRDTPILERLRLLRRYLMALDYAKSDGRSWLTREDVSADFFSITTDHRERFANYRHDAGKNMDPINALLSLEMIWTIPGQMMVKSDRTSMDAGVEVRSPLLDRDVIETAFCLDAENVS
jgi:asparagine synthase (glutamine-hydrolysing)